MNFIESFNNSNSDFELYEDGGTLYLRSLKHKEWLPFSIDFSSNRITNRKKQFGVNQEISRAFGIRGGYRPKILDTTAGLGRDSFLLASLGCRMTMLERNSVIYALLQNAMDNASLNEELKEIIGRMTLINKDSIEFLRANREHFDAIYIDPMFPKSKKSRLVKKDMQIFREIVGDDLDSSELLNLSLKQKASRVVVKRMINSEYINNLKPNFEIKGTTTRFDVYIPKL